LLRVFFAKISNYLGNKNSSGDEIIIIANVNYFYETSYM